jgi:hypothetical protein
MKQVCQNTLPGAPPEVVHAQSANVYRLAGIRYPLCREDASGRSIDSASARLITGPNVTCEACNRIIADEEKLRQLMKTEVMAHAARVAGLKIFKARFDSDDGWRFVAAKDAATATRILGKKARAATHDDLTMIAARALTGAF